ncbi:MAG: hypothetical protein HN383_12540 [Verrucomicrobia bacterium]|jgi:hypothetical protein|nr:hypothetical protein [Verrucomicrobiota bacterium]MBT7700150.1 hypothetical protein [Verrucomicrobiota bacterium]
MMLITLELLVVVYVAWVAWRIMRNRFLLNLLLGVSAAIGLGVAWAGGKVVVGLGKPVVDNPLLLHLLAASLASVIFFVVVYFLGRTVRKRAMRDRDQPVPAAGRALNLLLVALLLVGVIALIDFMVAVADYSELGSRVRERSLYLKFFLAPGESAHALPGERLTPGGDVLWTEEASLVEIMDKQAQFLQSLHSGFSSSTDALARKIGTQAVIDQVEALQFVLNLPAHDSAWLVTNTPQIEALLSNQHLQRVMSDPEILDKVIAAGEGSVSAIYDLSKNEELRALLEDPAIAEGIRGLDLQQMKERVLQHRQETSLTPSAKGRDATPYLLFPVPSHRVTFSDKV